MSTASSAGSCSVPNAEVTVTSMCSAASRAGTCAVSMRTLSRRSSSRRREPSLLRMKTVIWRAKRSGAGRDVGVDKVSLLLGHRAQQPQRDAVDLKPVMPRHQRLCQLVCAADAERKPPGGSGGRAPWPML
jgi:hypothetical protein